MPNPSSKCFLIPVSKLFWGFCLPACDSKSSVSTFWTHKTRWCHRRLTKVVVSLTFRVPNGWFICNEQCLIINRRPTVDWNVFRLDTLVILQAVLRAHLLLQTTIQSIIKWFCFAQNALRLSQIIFCALKGMIYLLTALMVDIRISDRCLCTANIQAKTMFLSYHVSCTVLYFVIHVLENSLLL